MTIATLGTSILFAGIPLFIGAFFMIRYFGRSKASIGASGLITGAAVTFIIAFYLDEPRIGGDGFTLSALSVAGISLVLGAVFGFISRRRGNDRN